MDESRATFRLARRWRFYAAGMLLSMTLTVALPETVGPWWLRMGVAAVEAFLAVYFTVASTVLQVVVAVRKAISDQERRS